MKSSIKVEFIDTDNGLQPVIKVKAVTNSIDSTADGDARDALLKSFFKKLGKKSSWLRVSFDHHIIGTAENDSEGEDKTFVTIIPVTDKELPEMYNDLRSRINPPTSGSIYLNSPGTGANVNWQNTEVNGVHLAHPEIIESSPVLQNQSIAVEDDRVLNYSPFAVTENELESARAGRKKSKEMNKAK